MKIHHLNCGTMCPRVPKFLLGHDHLVCHCLLLETPSGLTLIDSGFGLQDITKHSDRISAAFNQFVHPGLKTDETAIRQIEGLGFKASDVRHILLTHLDLDHAGGISDFPHAQIHVFKDEYQAAIQPLTSLEKHRYRAAQWAHHPHWVLHETQGDRWQGFESVRALDEKHPEILFIPLLGHTRGHCGIAIRTEQGWLLHAGDAYFHRGEVHPSHPHCSAGLKIFQNLVQVNSQLRHMNQRRLQQLNSAHGREVKIFCSHDAIELAQFD